MCNSFQLFVESISENWSYFKGDRVEVLVGKDKGKQGIVKQVIQERNWVIVEGLNWHYRKIADDESKNYAGVMIKSEAPLLVNIFFFFDNTFTVINIVFTIGNEPSFIG